MFRTHTTNTSLVSTRAFTLIELIVVVGLIASLAGFVVVGGAKSRNSTNLDLAARELESALLQAQAWGQTGKAADDNTANEDRFDYGYGIYVTRDAVGEGGVTNKQYALYVGDSAFFDTDNSCSGAECHANAFTDGGVSTAANQMVAKYQFPRGVFVKTIDISNVNDHDAHILFRRAWSTAILHEEQVNGYGSTAVITLEVTGGSTRQIQVSKTGLIEIL